MNIQFKNETSAEEFMSYLMDQNNQGVTQVTYRCDGLLGVDYSFNNVIHDDLYDRVDNKIAELAN